MQKRKGFTLIELLVVIAIIALLLAILLPSLAKIKKVAKASACMVHLKQWGSIFYMYADQNNGYFMGGGHSNNYENWCEQLRPYYGGRDSQGEIRICPETTKPGSRVQDDGDRIPNPRWNPTEYYYIAADRVADPTGRGRVAWRKGDKFSYGVNNWIHNPEKNPNDGGPIGGTIMNQTLGGPTRCYEAYWRTPYVKGANQVPMFGDNGTRATWSHHTNTLPDTKSWAWNKSNDQDNMIRIIINRHDGLFNWVYLDGTVHKLGLRSVWKLKWNRLFNNHDSHVNRYIEEGNHWPVWLRKFSMDVY